MVCMCVGACVWEVTLAAQWKCLRSRRDSETKASSHTQALYIHTSPQQREMPSLFITTETLNPNGLSCEKSTLLMQMVIKMSIYELSIFHFTSYIRSLFTAETSTNLNSLQKNVKVKFHIWDVIKHLCFRQKKLIRSIPIMSKSPPKSVVLQKVFTM